MGFSKKLLGSYSTDEELQPGEELYELLKSIYPIDTKNYLANIDSDFRADGQIANTFYESSILYLLRRLVITGQFIYRSNEKNLLKTRLKLAEHLDDYTRLSHDNRKDIVRLLLKCIDIADNEFTAGDTNLVKKQVAAFDWKCFVCGIEFGINNHHQASGDHLWPKTMGGLSSIENFRMVCTDCNNNHKGDFIGYPDYHFEVMALAITDYQEYKEPGKRKKQMEVAIFAKENYCCSVCQQPAYRVGKLHIGRMDINDGWHYFNLTAFCENHNPEK